MSAAKRRAKAVQRRQWVTDLYRRWTWRRFSAAAARAAAEMNRFGNAVASTAEAFRKFPPEKEQP